MPNKKLILYGIETSPPVRTVLLTLKALNLDYEFQVVNTSNGDHLKPEYLAKNPQHTIPALEDDGIMVWDSHAISAYLVRKFGQDGNDSLYPKDYQKRATCDQRLHYETGFLFYTCLKQITRALFLENRTEIPSQKIDQIHEAYKMLETFLDDKDFMVGNDITIADFSIVSTVSSLHLSVATIEKAKYPKLSAWFKRMEQLPYYEEANGKGAKVFANHVRSKLPKQFDKLWQKAMAFTKTQNNNH